MRTIGWRVIVEYGFHNHEVKIARLQIHINVIHMLVIHKVMATLFGHSNVGCLSSEEKTMVNQLTKNMVKPSQILLTIKDQDQTNDHQNHIQ